MFKSSLSVYRLGFDFFIISIKSRYSLPSIALPSSTRDAALFQRQQLTPLRKTNTLTISTKIAKVTRKKIFRVIVNNSLRKYSKSQDLAPGVSGSGSGREVTDSATGPARSLTCQKIATVDRCTVTFFGNAYLAPGKCCCRPATATSNEPADTGTDPIGFGCASHYTDK